MLSLRPDEISILKAFLDTVIPPDHDPGAVEAGVTAFVQERLQSNFELYRSGLMVLADRGFVRLDSAGRREVIERLEGHPTVAMMISHAIEGYYAGPESAGAKAVGFRVTI
ncbi:gluconate 2-dehydrogenase subunit 3 family protein [bacterium]|nr:MAG: gluconate 2-dehydrogenase subunit 3 family protein [bacterium]